MTVFNVPDMTCGHCEKAVTAALAKALPGVPVAVDLANHRVTLDGGDADKAQEAIRDAGYSPEKIGLA
ncbi:heavy-metal-associated domain-containing protein [Rhizobium helianthi]|uniref:Heavy-metal-associated domain-containing protein n=1 Tax=Rhizobium helianthi TaxID=1132695 RepID=A0ABW4M7B9_9HYPH